MPATWGRLLALQIACLPWRQCTDASDYYKSAEAIRYRALTGTCVPDHHVEAVVAIGTAICEHISGDDFVIGPRTRQQVASSAALDTVECFVEQRCGITVHRALVPSFS